MTTLRTAPRSLLARLLIIGLALPAATFVVTASRISARNPAAARSPLAAQASSPMPVAIGDQIAGSFDDATGHSAQSHLVYAANSRVWWLFTLTSNADTEGGSNHVVKSFHSSGPDLATATWIAGADSPPAVASAPNQFMGGGRALGVAYLNNSPVDVIHADISMAFDGQDGRTGHIRAIVTGTSISWASWNYFDEPAATWTLPRANTVGVSTGKFIHTGGPILQQEVDTNARRSTSADTGSTWTSGFSAPVVIDGSMLNQNNALAFAPLANNVMLAVYDNGQNVEPTQTNLRYKRSGANGTWSGIVVGSQAGGDGNVFPTTAVINQNDWGLVSVSTSQIYVFRRKANGTGIDGAFYNIATNTWSAMSPAPPAFGAGQAFKAGAGLFGATDGSSVWVCVINTDLANSILCARFDGTAWTPWSPVAGTETGIQNRSCISGSPRVGNNQIGLIWTEGTSLFDVLAYSFDASPDVTAPAVSVATPVNGATVSGTIAISATATDNVGVAGVTLKVDGVNLGPEITTAPYAMQWDTGAAANGAHGLTAIARDDAGNTATAAAVSVTVANAANIVPNVVGLTRAAATASIAAAGLTVGTVTTASSDVVSSGSVISQNPSGGAKVSVNSAVNLVVSSGAAPVTVPDVVGLTQSAATTAITNAGLVVGTVTSASNATVPSGAVISQTPAAATQVAIGSAVSLVVSSGPPPVAVPDVVGLTQAAAASAITSAGLKVGALTTAASTTVPSGSVMTQTPVAGMQVASGTAVALVVSSGPLKVAVPDVVGLTQAAATTAITNGALIVGAVTTAPSTTVPAGSVTSQTPAAATQVASGSAVSLVVSSGPPPAAVPNVVGLTQAAAATAITNAGLIVGTVTTASSTSVPAGSVISQTPAAATQVTSGSAVSLVVSSGAPPVAVPNVVGMTQAAATSAITGAGLKVGALTAAASTTVPSGSVITQTPAAGTQVASGTAVEIVLSSGPLKIAAPNVVGLTQAAATAAITNAGLLVGTVTIASSAAVPAGSVVSQDPAAGTGIPAASPVNLVVSSGPGIIGIDFVGSNAALMSATETAGLIPQSNWNSATGAAGTAQPLVDQSGGATNAAVTWSAAAVWWTRIPDAPGNPRMMKGYLNTSNTVATTVTVTGLTERPYDVYVYMDGDNRGDLRSANYTISGAGVTTTTTHVIDPINTDFGTTFTRADNSAGNYVKFRIAATSFTITATPISSVAGTPRAPVNGIQIVPTASAPADFTIAATPASQTVTPGTSTSYTATINALDTFSGMVGLTVDGAPAGTTATFTPASLSGTGDATLEIATSPFTPAGTWPLTIKGTSGQGSRTATVTLVVAQSAIGIKFLGLNPATMAEGDSAGVVPQTHWNNAAGAARSTAFPLVDHSGTASPATVTWAASGVWMVSIVDQPGNPRLMKGYLDNNNASVTTVSVDGLPPGDYDVYVYCDGDNKTYNRTATYEISGPGITATTTSVNDAPNANFSGTFTQATGSTGNYVKFRINGTGFTITATPGTSTNVNVRAPLNGIQIVSTSPTSPVALR